MELHLLLVLERLEPHEPVRVDPHRVVDTREVDVDVAAPLLEKVREQEAHLVHRERPLVRQVQLVPRVECGRGREGLGDELVVAVERRAALGADTAGEHVQEEERAGDLPAAAVAHGRATPGMRGQAVARPRDRERSLLEPLDRNLGLLGRTLEGELVVERFEQAMEVLEPPPAVLGVLGGLLGDLPDVRVLRELRRVLERLFPVHPTANELRVVLLVANQVARDGEQDGRLRTRPRRKPDVRARRGVREARVEHDQLRALVLALHDPLGVRVEVVPALEVRRDKQRRARVRVVRARAVSAGPHLVAGARSRRADVGVAVVPVDAPRADRAVGEVVFAGPSHVVHDAVEALLARRPHLRSDVLERLVPADALPLALAALADALERVEDPLRIIRLVVRRRTLRAVAPATARMHRVAFELADLERVLVDVGEQPAPALAVEADRRDERVAPRHLARPGLRVPLHPIVPAVGGRILGDAPVRLLDHIELHGLLLRLRVVGLLDGIALLALLRRRDVLLLFVLGATSEREEPLEEAERACVIGAHRRRLFSQLLGTSWGAMTNAFSKNQSPATAASPATPASTGAPVHTRASGARWPSTIAPHQKSVL